MDYTQNLHLPQFEETDRILHGDFNDAMSKIDAACATAPVPLFSQTLMADTDPWELDLSEFDLSKYKKLELVFYLQSTGADGGNTFLTCNRDESSGHYNGTGILSGGSKIKLGDLSSQSTGRTHISIQVYPIPGSILFRWTAIKVGVSSMEEKYGRYKQCPLSQLQQLTLSSEYAAQTGRGIGTGSRVALYGIR